MKKRYFFDKKADALFILIREGKEESVEELVPGINVELGKKGEILGVEILGVSRFQENRAKKAVLASPAR